MKQTVMNHAKKTPSSKRYHICNLR